MKIKGNAFLVTGGGSGLGAATAQYLADQGGKVTVFDLSETAAQKVASQIGGLAAAGDVCDANAVEAALDAGEQAHGPLRGVILCAGIGGGARVVGRQGPMPMADFDKVIRVNLSGSFNVMRLASTRMSLTEPMDDDERGAVIMTSSLAAYDGQIGQAAYAASKGGIVSMTLPVAREFSRFGIRVNTIAPGIFLTPLMKDMSEEAQKVIGKDIQFPARLGRPEEFAALVGSILTNPYINGEVIRIDAATRLPPR